MQSTRFSCQISIKPEFSRQISKITQILNFMQMLSVADEIFLTDGQTDMMKLTVAFAILPKLLKI